MHRNSTEYQPLLSICIATRNRANYLQETLLLFAAQINSNIEVVVVDGASTDGTPLLMEGLVEKFSWLTYLRLEKNGGIDADYDVCVRKARGVYCWLFSDDDWPLETAIQKIIGACQAGHSFIFVDAEVRDVEMNSVILTQRANLQQDSIYSPDQQDIVFDKTIGPLSFIGSCVLRRDLWLRSDTEHCLGYMFPHIGPLFDQKMPSTSLLLAKPLIAIRYGNATWTSSAFKIWMIYWPELIGKLRGVSDIAKSKASDAKPWLRIKNILWQRAKGIYSIEEYKFLRGRFDLSFLQKTKLQIVSRIPGGMSVGLAILAIYFASNSKPFLIAELKLSRFYKKRIWDHVAAWIATN